MKELLKKPWVLITGAFSILLLVIKFLLGRNRDLSSQVKNAESDKTDAVLNERQKGLAENHKAELEKLEAERGKKLSDSELEDWLKKL
jgi:hypothetical protein